MITVWALVWFFVTADGNVMAPTQIYATQELCKHDGDEMYALSQELKEQGKITNYAGACHEVHVDTKAGSI